MRHGFRHRQIQCFRCGLCGKLLTDSNQQSAKIDLALFGAAPYAVCPNCGHPDCADPESQEWRDKVDEWHKERK